MASWLRSERRLELKDPDARVRGSGGRFRYLGYDVDRVEVRPTDEALSRMRRHVSARVRAGDTAGVQRSVAAHLGAIRFVDKYVVVKT